MLLGYRAGMKRLVILLSFVLALPLLQARADQNPDDQYIIIYALMQQAGLPREGQARGWAALDHRG